MAQRKYLFPLAGVALTAIVIELVSLLFLQAYAIRQFDGLFHHDFRSELLRLPQEKLERFRNYDHDGELGWDTYPTRTRQNTNTAGKPWSYTIDELGARQDRFPGESALISAYGDSYTFGHEVNDNETWPHYLSELTGTRVLNFGVGAYGMDQALLKLRRSFQLGVATQVVVYAVWSGNPDRLLNSYRPFYRWETGLKLGFKPMVTEHEGGYVWIPNPLPRLDDRRDALEALQRAAVDDYWLRSRVISNRFPYSWRMFQLLWRIGRGEHERHYRPWTNEKATGRLRFLIEEFHRHSRAHGYVPVVVFIPSAHELRGRLAGRQAQYSSFAEELTKRFEGTELVLVDLYEVDFEEHRFNVSEFGTHLSPYGNRVVARAIHEAIGPLVETLSQLPSDLCANLEDRCTASDGLEQSASEVRAICVASSAS